VECFVADAENESRSPPGTCRVYLSCAELALPPKTASTYATITIIPDRVVFMAGSSPLSGCFLFAMQKTPVSWNCHFNCHRPSTLRKSRSAALSSTLRARLYRSLSYAAIAFSRFSNSTMTAD
jgi:hypothetical protein